MNSGPLWLEDEIKQLQPRLWSPAGPRGHADASPLAEYVVVDELEEEVAVLVIEPWPELDRKGRLNFIGAEARLEVEVDLHRLQPLLDDRLALAQLSPEQLVAFRKRPVRVGDVFCARVDRRQLETDPDSMGTWFGGPVVDVTPEARAAAKSQYFAAVGPVLSEKEVEQMAADFFAEG